MHRASRLFAYSLLVAASAAPTFAVAQRPTLPPCSGSYNVVRVSDIMPGKLDTFIAAVNAQKAWYKKAGTPDEIMLLRLVDPKTGTYSTTQALTFHRESGAKAPASDAGYDAFVALYKQSSTITSQYITCEAK